MRNKIVKNGFIFGIIILFTGLNINSSTLGASFTLNGTTLYVGGNGPGNYTSIQDAIDDASNGDIVFVYDNSAPYHENVEVDKSIDLIGENKETTIIDGNGFGNVVFISVNWVNVSGFTIQNGGGGTTDAGIYIRSNNSCISGNIIKNNFFGILQYKSTNNTIFRNNVTDNNNCGIVLANSLSTLISENFKKGQPFNGIGISEESKNNVISGNLILNNGYSGIRIVWSLDNDISHGRNSWVKNYWDRPRLFPKLILGRIGGLFGLFPWANFDWHPVKVPYNIER